MSKHITASYSCSLAPGECFAPAKTIDHKTSITIANTGNTLMLAYRGDTTDCTPPKPTSQILIGDTLITTIQKLPGNGPLLILRNASEIKKATVEISIG